MAEDEDLWLSHSEHGNNDGMQMDDPLLLFDTSTTAGIAAAATTLTKSFRATTAVPTRTSPRFKQKKPCLNFSPANTTQLLNATELPVFQSQQQVSDSKYDLSQLEYSVVEALAQSSCRNTNSNSNSNSNSRKTKEQFQELAASSGSESDDDDDCLSRASSASSAAATARGESVLESMLQVRRSARGKKAASRMTRESDDDSDGTANSNSEMVVQAKQTSMHKTSQVTANRRDKTKAAIRMTQAETQHDDDDGGDDDDDFSTIQEKVVRTSTRNQKKVASLMTQKSDDDDSNFANNSGMTVQQRTKARLTTQESLVRTSSLNQKKGTKGRMAQKHALNETDDDDDDHSDFSTNSIDMVVQTKQPKAARLKTTQESLMVRTSPRNKKKKVVPADSDDDDDDDDGDDSDFTTNSSSDTEVPQQQRTKLRKTMASSSTKPRPSGKKIQQIDIKTGKIVGSFRVMSEAARSVGFCRQIVGELLRGTYKGGSKNGWTFRYSNDDESDGGSYGGSDDGSDDSSDGGSVDDATCPGRKGYRVKQIDVATGKSVASFASYSLAARRTGISRQKISQLASGPKNESYQGWSFQRSEFRAGSDRKGGTSIGSGGGRRQGSRAKQRGHSLEPGKATKSRTLQPLTRPLADNSRFADASATGTLIGLGTARLANGTKSESYLSALQESDLHVDDDRKGRTSTSSSGGRRQGRTQSWGAKQRGSSLEPGKATRSRTQQPRTRPLADNRRSTDTSATETLMGLEMTQLASVTKNESHQEGAFQGSELSADKGRTSTGSNSGRRRGSTQALGAKQRGRSLEPRKETKSRPHQPRTRSLDNISQPSAAREIAEKKPRAKPSARSSSIPLQVSSSSSAGSVVGVGAIAVEEFDATTGRLLNVYPSLTKAAAKAGVTRKNISAVLLGTLHSFKGKKWRYHGTAPSIGSKRSLQQCTAVCAEPQKMTAVKEFRVPFSPTGRPRWRRYSQSPSLLATISGKKRAFSRSFASSSHCKGQRTFSPDETQSGARPRKVSPLPTTVVSLKGGGPAAMIRKQDYELRYITITNEGSLGVGIEAHTLPSEVRSLLKVHHALSENSAQLEPRSLRVSSMKEDSIGGTAGLRVGDWVCLWEKVANDDSDGKSGNVHVQYETVRDTARQGARPVMFVVARRVNHSNSEIEIDDGKLSVSTDKSKDQKSGSKNREGSASNNDERDTNGTSSGKWTKYTSCEQGEQGQECSQLLAQNSSRDGEGEAASHSREADDDESVPSVAMCGNGGNLYLAQREARIARNLARLQDLGLVKVSKAPPPIKKKRKPTAAPLQQDAFPRRRSKRVVQVQETSKVAPSSSSLVPSSESQVKSRYRGNKPPKEGPKPLVNRTARHENTESTGMSRDKSTLKLTKPVAFKHDLENQSEETLVDTNEKLTMVWKNSENIWGRAGHYEGDVVIFSTHQQQDSLFLSPRYEMDPLSATGPYRRTHVSPEEGYQAIVLKRDALATRGWGFSCHRHELGRACLVCSVEPFSPNETACLLGAGCSDTSKAPLRVHDMILAVNGKTVGGTTSVEVELEFEASRSEMILLVSRYRFEEGTLENSRRGEAVSAPDAADTEVEQKCFECGDSVDSLPCFDTSFSTGASSFKHGSTFYDPVAEDDLAACLSPTAVEARKLNLADFQGDHSDESEIDAAMECVCGCVCGVVHELSVEVFWIQCDGCDAWYNTSADCLGFSESEAAAMKEWTCWGCPSPPAKHGSLAEWSISNFGTSRYGKSRKETVATGRPVASPLRLLADNQSKPEYKRPQTEVTVDSEAGQVFDFVCVSGKHGRESTTTKALPN